MARRFKNQTKPNGLRWRVELGKNEDMPINHNAAPRMHSESAFPLNAEHSAPLCGSHSPTTHHPALKEREERRASYAKVPHKQQLAHNKSAIKYLLSMT